MTTGLYVFGEYVKRLQTLYHQNKVNVSFRETVRLIARNPLNFYVSRDGSNDHIKYTGQDYRTLDLVLASLWRGSANTPHSTRPVVRGIYLECTDNEEI